MNSDQIRKRAQALDEAIEKRDVGATLGFFSEDCTIEMFGLTLKGQDGLMKAIGWMYDHLQEISLIPVTIMIDGSTWNWAKSLPPISQSGP
jgi:ketosteroid isomerase-like protein